MTAAVLRIPRAPERLALPIERRWDGAPVTESHLHGAVELAAHGDGLEMVARLPHQPAPRIPDAPAGARVPDLWEYDVVECFLVGARGRYLELELGAGGHFLLLSFDAPRWLVDDHADFVPRLRFERGDDAWCATIELPEALLPPGLCRVNAFVVAGGRFLAWHPLPGAAPDFHQPERFPRVVLGS